MEEDLTSSVMQALIQALESSFPGTKKHSVAQQLQVENERGREGTGKHQRPQGRAASPTNEKVRKKKWEETVPLINPKKYHQPIVQMPVWGPPNQRITPP